MTFASVLVGAFNQEKALVGTFYVIVDCKTSIFAKVCLKLYWSLVPAVLIT